MSVRLAALIIGAVLLAAVIAALYHAEPVEPAREYVASREARAVADCSARCGRPAALPLQRTSWGWRCLCARGDS